MYHHWNINPQYVYYKDCLSLHVNIFVNQPNVSISSELKAKRYIKTHYIHIIQVFNSLSEGEI